MDSYSRLVSIFKITLPLVALALLSTLFLFARSPAQTNTIPFAELESIAREPRITAAHFVGVAGNGALMDVTAESFIPRETSASDLIKPSATLVALSGTTYSLFSSEGRLDEAENRLDLSGLVHFESDSGLKMETRLLHLLDNGALVIAPSALEMRTPLGRLTAGALRAETGTATQMQFTGGVRLIYQAPHAPLATEGHLQ